jgi:hypothetical protein
MRLYTPAEIENFQNDLPYLIQTYDWIKNFLARPHHDLGRSGKVCPYIPYSLKANTIQLAVIHSQALSKFEIEEIVKGYKNTFLQAEATTAEASIYKVILLLFPDVNIEDTPTVMDDVQKN